VDGWRDRLSIWSGLTGGGDMLEAVEWRERKSRAVGSPYLAVLDWTGVWEFNWMLAKTQWRDVDSCCVAGEQAME